MQVSKISSDDWTLIAFFVVLGACAIVGIIVAGWMDLEQNKIITECIRAGKTWKDGNCG